VLLPEARALVDRLSLTPRISFVGRLSDGELDAWYSRSRVVVVTSMVAESFCMVGIDAMAHGRPVVAFDVGGIREWLEDGVTGFAVSRGDSRALAAAVRRLLAEPGLAERFGEAGRERVDHRFRRATHVAGLLGTLEAARDAWAETTRVRELRHLRRAMGAIS
jgi:glycosyltransferase involved in cell wall biosynthesis